LAVSKITAVPEQISATPGGLDYLTQLLTFISPVESAARIPIDMALARNYLFNTNAPVSARRALEDAESLLAKARLTPNTVAEEGLKDSLVTVHCWLAYAIVKTGEPDVAERKLSVCLQEAKAIGTEKAMNFAEATSASVRALTNNPSAAEPVQYWIKTLGDTPELRRAYAFSLSTGKDFDGAIREMSLAAAMFEKAGRTEDLAQAYGFLSFYYEMKKEPDYKTAVQYLKKAVALNHTQNDDKQEADAGKDLGFAYAALGDYDNAHRSFTSALQLAEKVSSWETAARCLWGLAELRGNVQSDEVASLYHRAGELFSKAGLPDQQSIVFVNEANALRNQGHNEQALPLLLRARDLAEQSNSNPARVNAYNALGYAYESAGQYSNALLAFTTARDKAAESKNVLSQAYSDLAISGICQLVGEWPSALQHATSALDEFKSLEDEKGELFAYSELLGVYTERSSDLKDFKKASSLYVEASSLKTFKSESTMISVPLLEMYTQTLGGHPKPANDGHLKTGQREVIPGR